MSELAAIITALGGLLAVLAGGVKFVWDKFDARFAAIETKLAECEAREDAGSERRSKLYTVAALLMSELRRVAKDSPVLREAEQILDELKVNEKG